MKLINKSFPQQILLTLFIYFLTLPLAAQKIELIHVPDSNFRFQLGFYGIQFDATNNITNPEKAAQTEKLEIVPYTEISNLSGIEAFKSLKYLSCENNNLVVLDLSSNTLLIKLEVAGNQLTDLNISNNTSLTSLNCSNNQLITLDVSKNINLVHLSCDNNQLTNPDVSKNINLSHLSFGDNQLTNLDVSKNTNLTHLFCDNNQLTNLDVSKNINLEFISCLNNQLSELDLTQNPKIVELDKDMMDLKIIGRFTSKGLPYDLQFIYRLIFDALLLISILILMIKNPDIKKQSIALYVFMILFWTIDIIIKSSIEYGAWKFDILFLFAFWVITFILITIFFLVIRKTKKTKWDWMLFFLCTPVMPILFLLSSYEDSSLLMQEHGIIQNFVGELIAVVVIVVLVIRHRKKQKTDRIL